MIARLRNNNFRRHIVYVQNWSYQGYNWCWALHFHNRMWKILHVTTGHPQRYDNFIYESEFSVWCSRLKCSSLGKPHRLTLCIMGLPHCICQHSYFAAVFLFQTWMNKAMSSHASLNSFNLVIETFLATLQINWPTEASL